MQEKENNTTFTEAVAIFHDAQSRHATVDELLTSGFDHAELSVLACEQTIREKLGHNYKSTADFEDDRDAPRVEYVPDESIGSTQGGIIAAVGYLAAVFGLLAVVASGGTLLGAIAVVAIAGGAGAALGATRAKKDAELFFICRSGVRSRMAAEAMANAGYGRCRNVADGFEGPLDANRHRGQVAGWKSAGLPWVQG